MLKTTVIAKTDIYQYSSRTTRLDSEGLSSYLEEHKSFINEFVDKHGGHIVKGEGDAFYLIFDSVTVASKAMIDIQKALRSAQSGKGEAERVAIRAAITVGDVLHQGDDIFGNAVNLAARIEAIAPVDEVYLSQAAWMSLNHAEVKTQLVDEYQLKGMAYPENIYRLDIQHKTEVYDNQAMIVTDLRGIVQFMKLHSQAINEMVLIHYEDLLTSEAMTRGGRVRFIYGDALFITFPDVDEAIHYISKIRLTWLEYTTQNSYELPLHFTLHFGTFKQLRSYLLGDDVNDVFRISYQQKRHDLAIAISEQAKEHTSEAVRDSLIPVTLPEPMDTKLYTLKEAQNNVSQ